MANFTRTQTDFVWTNGGAGHYVPTLSDLQNLCDKAFASLNGDRGGTWAPSSPIVVNTGGMRVSGPAVVNYDLGKLKTSSGARFFLGTGDWPRLASNHIGRTRSLRSDLLARLATPRYYWLAAPGYPGSIQTVACTINGASGIEQPRCHIPLRVHNGARLTSITLTFRIPQPRTKTPSAPPRIRIVRTDKDGTIEPLRSIASGADANGYVPVAAPSTGAAWYANGAAQTLEYACDVRNTIDTATYLYWAEIIEEIGAPTPLPAIGASAADGFIVRERKTGVKKVYLPALGNQSMAGTPAGTAIGDSVLLMGQTAPSLNGLWVITAAGNWTRRFDLDAPEEFAPGFLIIDANTQDVFELVSPYAPQTFTLDTDPASLKSGASPIVFQRRTPRGNIYHSLACHFDSIVDMRPQ